MMTVGHLDKNIDLVETKFDPSLDCHFQGQESWSPAVRDDNVWFERKALDGSVIRIKHPLHWSVFEEGLSDCKDPEFVNYILNSIKEGADIGIKPGIVGRRPFQCRNHPSSVELAVKLDDALEVDVNAGTKIGPFNQPPLEGFTCSPLSVIPKKEPGKVRIIHNLSSPRDASVNDLIGDEDAHVEFESFDSFVDKVRKIGTRAWMFKTDLSAAYKSVVVKPSQWQWQGLHISKPGERRKYFFDTTLAFGCRSSVKIFSQFTKAICIIARKRGIPQVFGYIDDFCVLGESKEECVQNASKFLTLLKELGFVTNRDKTEGPSQVMTVLGIEVDAPLQQLRIDSQRLQNILTLLQQWSSKSKASKREIASLVGKLHFVATVCPSGRSFLRRLIELMKKAEYWDSEIEMTAEAKADILWWNCFLPYWNGVSMIPDFSWTTDADITLYTDACPTGAGGFYQGRWFHFLFKDWLFKQSMPFKELFAVALALATWGHEFRGKKIRFRIDSQTAAVVLNSKRARSPAMAAILRQIFYLCAIHDCMVGALWLEGVLNAEADAASRGEYARLFEVTPYAARCPDTVPRLFVPAFFREFTSVPLIPAGGHSDSDCKVFIDPEMLQHSGTKIHQAYVLPAVSPLASQPGEIYKSVDTFCCPSVRAEVCPFYHQQLSSGSQGSFWPHSEPSVPQPAPVSHQRGNPIFHPGSEPETAYNVKNARTDGLEPLLPGLSGGEVCLGGGCGRSVWNVEIGRDNTKNREGVQFAAPPQAERYCVSGFSAPNTASPNKDRPNCQEVPISSSEVSLQ